MTPQHLLNSLQNHGIREVAGVPDSLLADFCAVAQSSLSPEHFTVCANEGLAISWASAQQMVTGHPALVFLQNSGLGHCVNPLLSLASEAVYHTPLFLLIGWRGKPGSPDEPQHLTQGAATLELLHSLHIPTQTLTGNDPQDEAALDDLFATLLQQHRTVALLVPKGTLACADSRPAYPPSPYQEAPLSRAEAIRAIVEALPTETRFVATTGMISRELYALRQALQQPHDHDFLVVGSMGHASTLALGFALAHPYHHFVCLDGDGALLMHSGALALVGRKNPPNLSHVVLDNACHDSVGGLPSASESLAIPAIARGFGYPHAAQTNSAEGIATFFQTRALHPGLAMLVVRVHPGHSNNLPRPKDSPKNAKDAFLKSL